MQLLYHVVREGKVKQFYFSCKIYFHLDNAGRVTGIFADSSLEFLIFTIMTARPMMRMSADTAMKTGISIRIKLSDRNKLDLISSTYSSGRDMPCKIKMYIIYIAHFENLHATLNI